MVNWILFPFLFFISVEGKRQYPFVIDRNDQITFSRNQTIENTRLLIGIALFNNVDVLDVFGPFEVFSLAGENDESFKVMLIGTRRITVGRNGLRITADVLYTDKYLPKFDVLVVPGANRPPIEELLNNARAMTHIGNLAKSAKYVLSVCTGASVIARLGLTDGLQITTHHWAFDLLSQNGPYVIQRRDCRYTDNGNVLSSAGVSAGIDLSLYFVRKILGMKRAMLVEGTMEYKGNWKTINPTCISKM